MKMATRLPLRRYGKLRARLGVEKGSIAIDQLAGSGIERVVSCAVTSVWWVNR